MMNEMLNCSSEATTLGTWTFMEFCANAVSEAAISANIIAILFMILPILLFLAGLEQGCLFLVHLVLCLFFLGLDGLKHLLGLLRGYPGLLRLRLLSLITVVLILVLVVLVLILIVLILILVLVLVLVLVLILVLVVLTTAASAVLLIAPRFDGS